MTQSDYPNNTTTFWEQEKLLSIDEINVSEQQSQKIDSFHPFCVNILYMKRQIQIK